MGENYLELMDKSKKSPEFIRKNLFGVIKKDDNPWVDKTKNFITVINHIPGEDETFQEFYDDLSRLYYKLYKNEKANERQLLRIYMNQLEVELQKIKQEFPYKDKLYEIINANEFNVDTSVEYQNYSAVYTYIMALLNNDTTILTAMQAQGENKGQNSFDKIREKYFSLYFKEIDNFFKGGNEEDFPQLLADLVTNNNGFTFADIKKILDTRFSSISQIFMDTIKKDLNVQDTSTWEDIQKSKEIAKKIKSGNSAGNPFRAVGSYFSGSAGAPFEYAVSDYVKGIATGKIQKNVNSIIKGQQTNTVDIKGDVISIVAVNVNDQQYIDGLLIDAIEKSNNANKNESLSTFNTKLSNITKKYFRVEYSAKAVDLRDSNSIDIAGEAGLNYRIPYFTKYWEYMGRSSDEENFQNFLFSLANLGNGFIADKYPKEAEAIKKMIMMLSFGFMFDIPENNPIDIDDLDNFVPDNGTIHIYNVGGFFITASDIFLHMYNYLSGKKNVGWLPGKDPKILSISLKTPPKGAMNLLTEYKNLPNDEQWNSIRNYNLENTKIGATFSKNGLRKIIQYGLDNIV